MTGAGRPTDEELSEYVDGALSEERRGEIAAWLAAHLDKAAEVERLQRLNEALKGLGASILKEPVPERLRRVLSQGPSGSGRDSAPDFKTEAVEEGAAGGGSASGDEPDDAPPSEPAPARSRPRSARAAPKAVAFALGALLA